MTANFENKARNNRFAAIQYLSVQKSKLVSLTDYRPSAAPRAPLPAYGFSSIRAGAPHGAVA